MTERQGRRKPHQPLLGSSLKTILWWWWRVNHFRILKSCMYKVRMSLQQVPHRKPSLTDWNLDAVAWVCFIASAGGFAHFCPWNAFQFERPIFQSLFRWKLFNKWKGAIQEVNLSHGDLTWHIRLEELLDLVIGHYQYNHCVESWSGDQGTNHLKNRGTSCQLILQFGRGADTGDLLFGSIFNASWCVFSQSFGDQSILRLRRVEATLILSSWIAISYSLSPN